MLQVTGCEWAAGRCDRREGAVWFQGEREKGIALAHESDFLRGWMRKLSCECKIASPHRVDR